MDPVAAQLGVGAVLEPVTAEHVTQVRIALSVALQLVISRLVDGRVLVTRRRRQLRGSRLEKRNELPVPRLRKVADEILTCE